MSNGSNGHSQVSDLPGLWILIIDGGVGYLACVNNEGATEADLADELTAKGHVGPLELRPVYVLDCVRGVMPDENRGLVPHALPIAQRLDQRIGLPDDFAVHMSARSIVFLSQLSPATRATLARTVDNAERSILMSRAKQAGIIAPGARS
jgi:hypothetical protein